MAIESKAIEIEQEEIEEVEEEIEEGEEATKDQPMPIVFQEGYYIRMKEINDHFKMKRIMVSVHVADPTAEDEAVRIVGREKIPGRRALRRKEKKRFARK